MEQTKGFLTIATGREEYYRLARNLLRSYRCFTKEPLPFTLLADRENEFTSEFDSVVLFADGAQNCYLDKLSMGEYLPYDVNIFIDSDCLAYGDLNRLFNLFEDADDFSCFGRVLPLDDKTGWFEYDNLGALKEKVSYVVGLHGGIYYMRRTDLCLKVLKDAQSFVPDYPKFRFKGKFDTPGDEPLVALSMSVNDCRPIPFVSGAICCYWEHVGHMTLDITKGLARVNTKPKFCTDLLHWGTRYTRELEYRKQVALLEIMRSQDESKQQRSIQCSRYYDRLIAKRNIVAMISRVKNKAKRMLGLM